MFSFWGFAAIFINSFACSFVFFLIPKTSYTAHEDGSASGNDWSNHSFDCDIPIDVQEYPFTTWFQDEKKRPPCAEEEAVHLSASEF